jgi:UDP-4-amino-4,6-dideoxy-N-acetyl-beta-L-altrosamine N-acetyltransferase
MLVSLRDIKPADAEKTREWRNHPDVGKYMFTDHVITREEHAAWFQRITEDARYKVWIIVCNSEDVGLANLYDIDLRNRRCYWGSYVADPQLRGKGIGSFVEYLVLRFVFDDLQLHKLCCEVLAFNKSAIDIHTGFGFVQEGVLRQHIFKNGQAHDVVSLAMFSGDWHSNKQRLTERMRTRGML